MSFSYLLLCSDLFHFSVLRDPTQIPAYMSVKTQMKHNLLRNWVLVLPPWGPLHHWYANLNNMQTDHSTWEKPSVSGIRWSNFFDLDSLSQFIPVMDMHEFQEDGERKLPPFVICYIILWYAP